jgi:hypothetical protein
LCSLSFENLYSDTKGKATMTPNAVVEPSNISVLVIATKAVIHPTTRTCMESLNVQVFLRAATSMPSLQDTDTKTALIAQNTPTDYAASKEDNRQMQAATNFNADQQMHAATNFTADKEERRTNQVNLRTFPLVCTRLSRPKPDAYLRGFTLRAPSVVVVKHLNDNICADMCAHAHI